MKHGAISSKGKEFLFLSKLSGPALLPTWLPIQWILQNCFPGVKQPGNKVDHSPTSSAEARNEWRSVLTPTFSYGV